MKIVGQVNPHVAAQAASLRRSPTVLPDSLDKGETSKGDTTHLHEFLGQFSSLKVLRGDCARFRRCNARLCPACHCRHAANARRQLRAPAREALQLTLTIPVYREISMGFEMLTAARKAFERILKRDHRVDAYVVAAEVTRPATRWHWHLHAVVFGNEFEVLADDLRSLWLEAAGSVGVPVAGCAQNAVVKSAEDALGYVVKGKLGGGSDSLMGLLRRAATGEVDAVDGWAELEVFAGRGHRWLHTYRMRDAQSTVQKRTPVHAQLDVRLMILAELLGATSSRIQSRMVTTSGSTLSRPTISRIRRDDPLYRRWRRAPASVTRW